MSKKRTGKALLTAVVAVGLAGYSATGGEWPRFMGPQGNGLSAETGFRKNWNEQAPRQVWRRDLSDKGYAGPAVAQGKVFIVDRDGKRDVVRAMDIATGKDVWTFAYDDPGRANYGFARATPTVDGDRVYTLGRNGHLHCLNVKDGSLVWQRNIVAEFKGRTPTWQLAMSPLVDGDRLIMLPGGDKNVAALDKRTGKTVWHGGNADRLGYATPVPVTVGGVRQYLVFNGFALTGIHTENGSVLWRQEWRTSHDVNAALPVPVGDGRVFITSGYGRGCALLDISGASPRIVWENKEVVAHFSSPILYKGHLYANSDPTHLVCLDPKTGEAKWKQPGFGKGGLLIADGVIIALDGNRGDAIMVRATPEKYEELGRFRPLGGRSWTAPVLAGGMLIVRNQSAIACFELR